jgi:putative addiction module antidote
MARLSTAPAGMRLDKRARTHQCYNMTIKTKVRKIGNSCGIVLPKEALALLKVREGDTLYLTESPGGALRINKDTPGFADKMAIAEQCMQRYHNALKELAK